MAWNIVATIYVAIGGVTLILGASGALPDFGNDVIRASNGISLTIGAALFGVARLEPDDRWLHLVAAIAFTHIAAALLVVDGDIAMACVALYMLPVFATSSMLGGRQAAPHAAIAIILVVVTLIVRDGTDIPARAAATGIAIVGGTMMLAIMRGHMSRAISRYRVLAETDALTGIANLRGLRARLASVMREARVNGDELTVFAIDLDGFKRINDKLSHSAGDRVLIAAARALAELSARSGFAARRGGDEFVAVALHQPGFDPLAVEREFGAALRAARGAACPQLPGGARIGRVTWRPDETVEELLARADQRLFEVRSGTRGRESRIGKATASKQRTPALAAQHRDASQCARAANTVYAKAGDAGGAPSHDEIRIAWNLGAVMSIVAAGSIFAFALTGWNHDVRGPLPLLAASIFAISSGIYALFARRDTPRGLVHMAAVVTGGAVVLLVAGAGDSKPALVDAFATTILFVFLSQPPLRALPYAVVSLALFAWFLRDAGEPNVSARTVVTAMVVLTTAMTLILMRRKTSAFMALIARETELDPLTGVANLRALRAHLDVLLAGASAPARDLTIMQLDLDDFKSVNDMVGHAYGDAVLIAVAGAIGTAVREDEFYARRGGDEFTIVAPTRDPRAIEALAARIRSAIETVRRELLPDLPSTITVGFATHRPAEPSGMLIRRADLALCDTKQERAMQAEYGRAAAHAKSPMKGDPAAVRTPGAGAGKISAPGA